MPSVTKLSAALCLLALACGGQIEAGESEAEDHSGVSSGSEVTQGPASDLGDEGSSDESGEPSLEQQLFVCATQCLIYCEHEGTGAGENIIDDCSLECMGWTDTASIACLNNLHFFGACAEFYSMHGCVERAPYIPKSPCSFEFETAVEICVEDAQG